MIDLARELAAHGRFAWRPGMGTWDGGVVVAADSEEDCHTVWTRGRLESCVTSSYLGAPHLNASGTIGGLLKMLWEIDHKAHTYCNAGVWYVTFADAEGATPGEALARALLAAWGRDDG